ncbi:MAG: tyrosine-type recombinase/integrase [Pyrinomonadaceae bacterium]
MTFDQEIKLLKACETEDRRHLRALILVAVDTGARSGELINLTKSQIDFRAGKILGLLNYKDLGGDKTAPQSFNDSTNSRSTLRSY